MIEYLILGLGATVAIIVTQLLQSRTLAKAIKSQNSKSKPVKSELKEIEGGLDRIEVRDLRRRMMRMEGDLEFPSQNEENLPPPDMNEAMGFDVKGFWESVPGYLKPLANGFVKGQLGFTVEDAIDDVNKTGQLFEFVRGIVQPMVEKYWKGGGRQGQQRQQGQIVLSNDIPPMLIDARGQIAGVAKEPQ